MSKKSAKNQPKEQTYELRDVVLAKVRGYPAWPGMVVDPDSVPASVAKERPNAKSKKGQWYCVRFFPVGDYAWMVPKDMSKLQQHEIQAYIDEPFKRSGELLAGYKIALDPKKWEAEREAQRVELMEAEDNAEIDQLDHSEAEDEDEEKPKTKKRKRDSEAAPTKAKSKTKAKKEPAEPKKKVASTTKGKKNGVKSKAMVESEDEAGADDDDAGPSKKASPPPTKKQKRSEKDEEEVDAALANDPEATKVRDWRHKLQKAFLGKSSPKDEDIPGLDQLFTTVENYENMNIQYLTFSKIGKVMRHLHALSDDKVPRDDEFKFRERAKALVDKWHEILSANKAAEGTIRKPTTNGKAHTEELDAKTKENGKEESPAQETQKTDGDDMDIDDKKDGTADAEAEADAPAEADDAPADGVVDESVEADVPMSEAETTAT